MRLIEMAVERGADIAQLEKLMDLQERYEAGQSKKAFNLAMSVFQSMLPVIEKLGVVDYESSKGRTFYQYAKIEDIAKAIQPALKESGLSYRFTQSQSNGAITVKCIVTHKSGHSEFSELSSAPDSSGGKDQLKGIASAITYLRRYTLTGILGIVVGGEDDDGGHVEIEKPSEIIKCYPDEEFKKNFPRWKKMIEDGKKTPDQMLEFLQSKNVVISQSQFDSLKQVEVK
jgi:hypothetical protein